MRTLGVIVGRGGSKRLPGKALRLLGGHPLIGWATRAAVASYLDRVIVSTDDPDIAAAAETHGAAAPFMRPVELAYDDVENDAVLTHALHWMVEAEGRPFDVVVLIQPTTPFVRPEDIDACIAGVLNKGAASCFTVVAAPIIPEAMFREQPDGTATPVTPGPWLGRDKRNHPLPPAYQPNGAIWAVSSEVFLETGDTYSPPYRVVPMPRDRSVDINFESDLAVAEALRVVNGLQITGPTVT